MSVPGSQKKELSQFLAEHASDYLGVKKVLSAQLTGCVFDVLLFKMDRDAHTIFHLRIVALNAIDYAIRPPNPATLEGGPRLKFSTDDPRLDNPKLQYVPGTDDGEVFQPPRRYQFLELDQSWIIAERFEVEELERVTSLWKLRRPGQSGHEPTAP